MHTGCSRALPARRRRHSASADEAVTLGASATLAISRSRYLRLSANTRQRQLLSIAPIIEPAEDSFAIFSARVYALDTTYTRMNTPDDVIEPFRNDPELF